MNIFALQFDRLLCPSFTSLHCLDCVFVYDRCRKSLTIGITIVRCSECDFDICQACAAAANEANEKLHDHELVPMIVGPESTMQTALACDLCNVPCDWIVYHCDPCCFDLCLNCFIDAGRNKNNHAANQ